MVGSLAGLLRVFLPRAADFQAEDQLLEVQLEHPILQIEYGRFAHDGRNALAILHPRSLAVYELRAQDPERRGGGQVDAESSLFHSLHRLYQHRFERPTHSMVHGGFGGIEGADLICVQSMDGQISIIEREVLSFQRTLPNFLVPGPLCYLPRTDCFVTCNSGFDVECYKYHVLASASAERGNNINSKMNHTKKLQVEWKVNIGERAIEIRTGRITKGASSSQSEVIVIGEHSLCILGDVGDIRLTKRLDYMPLTCHVNDAPGGGSNLIVASHTGSLLVYKGHALVWAAKHDLVPIAVATGTFGGVRGLVVALDEEGAVVASFMGTDPQTEVMGAYDTKELDYEAMDAEHRRLLGQIRAATSQTKAEPTDRIVLRAQVPSQLDASREAAGGRAGVSKRRASTVGLTNSVTIKVFVNYTGMGSIENVQLNVRTPSTVYAEPSSFEVQQITGNTRGTPLVFDVTLVATPDHMPGTSAIEITASYMAATGDGRSSVCSLPAPLALFGKFINPVKSANFKITMETNRTPPLLRTLFEDVIAQSPFSDDLLTNNNTGNVVSFQYLNGDECTIVVSKSAGRYRLQSEKFEAIWLLATELAERLRTYYKEVDQYDGSGGEPFRITCNDPVPLQDFFNVIDVHFASRQYCDRLAKALEIRAQQFRTIQKRLLVRFKERNPASLSHLDKLLEETYHELLELSESMEEGQREIVRLGGALAGSCQLILLLMRFKFDLSPESFDVLKCYLSPEVPHKLDQGWEELTETALTFLLRTALAKHAKETVTMTQPIAPLEGTSKLKKHIALVCERLSKGVQLAKPRGETRS